MKKTYLFALFAAIGLLNSCSSDDLGANGPQVPVIDESKQAPIELSISRNTLTRGTGTVGTDNASTNCWAGQKVNVFMLEKGTVIVAQDEEGNDIYSNATLATPDDGINPASDIAVLLSIDGVTPMYRYYPNTGVYDFWGYRTDGAETTAPSIDSTKKIITIPFTIDGSQDLMVGKAIPTVNDDGNVMGTFGGSPEAVPADKVYSAYSARRGIQPSILFKHLLSRLVFTIIGSTADICLDTAKINPTNAAYDPIYAGNQDTQGVRITDIKLISKNTGKLYIAAVDTATYPLGKIEWDELSGTAKDTLALQQRQKSILTAAEITPQDVSGASGTLTTGTKIYSSDGSIVIGSNIPIADFRNNTSNICFYDSNLLDPETGYPTGHCGAYDATHKYIMILTADAVYSKFDADVATSLVKLQPTPPLADNGTALKTPIGEALLIAPGETEYLVLITLKQYVATSAITGAWKYLTIKKKLAFGPSGSGLVTDRPTEAAKSYKVNITVNGLSSIDISTPILEPWEDGGSVDLEDDSEIE